MKLFYVTLFTSSLLAVSCTPPSTEQKKETSPGVSAAQLYTNYHEGKLKLFPLDATFAGDPRYNDLLPNSISVAFRNNLKSFYEGYRDSLSGMDRSSLHSEEQMSYDILLWECENNLENLKFPTHLMPVNQFSCLPLQMGQFAGGTGAQPFKTVSDYEHWLKRVDAFTEWCDTAMANMRIGIKEGIVLPKVLAEKMVPQFTEFAKKPAEENLYFSPVKQMPKNFSEADKTRLKESYKKMVSEKIIPLFERMQHFLKEEYLPACRTSSGISAVPNGKEYYALQIKTYTTTNMSADTIFALGEKEVLRITEEMEKVKALTGYKGTLKEFFNHVRARKELMPFTDPAQVIDNFKSIHDKMKPHLAKLFDLVPKTQFEVRRTESFREKSASAEYNQGSIDGSRPGIFYVPVPDVKSYNYFSDEDLFLHEAIPGHHYQISLQQENKNLPEFRRTLWYSAYGEGWALYTESLGKELGLYTDPYQYFGMLSAEMHRAIRLVVDAGIHAKGWTREQAIQYSLDHEAEPEAGIIAEIERYMSWPGQALSYKIGQLKIRELRAKAAKELGAKFDIREFHNKVLESGCVPLEILEKKINEWIAEKR